MTVTTNRREKASANRRGGQSVVKLSERFEALPPGAMAILNGSVEFAYHLSQLRAMVGECS